MAKLVQHQRNTSQSIRIDKLQPGTLVRLGPDGTGSPAICIKMNEDSDCWPAVNLLTGSPVHYSVVCVPLSPNETIVLSN